MIAAARWPDCQWLISLVSVFAFWMCPWIFGKSQTGSERWWIKINEKEFKAQHYTIKTFVLRVRNHCIVTVISSIHTRPSKCVSHVTFIVLNMLLCLLLCLDECTKYYMQILEEDTKTKDEASCLCSLLPIKQAFISWIGFLFQYSHALVIHDLHFKAYVFLYLFLKLEITVFLEAAECFSVTDMCR